MERFAKIQSIGKRRKLDVTRICRCCGLEGDEMHPILAKNSEEIEFQVKVFRLLGIEVKKTDKLPQMMCVICIDKINDFYEFRLMAEHTDKQTREALGLPEQERIPKQVVLQPQIQLFDIKDSLLKNIPSTSKKRADKPAVVAQPPTKKSKKDVSCLICVDIHFGYQDDLNDHLSRSHQAKIAKYACGSCRETFAQLSENKAHDSWHSRQKQPYTCYICSSIFTKVRDFNKHMTNYNCPEKEKLFVTVEDIRCFQCKKKFLTQNLFEWHGCFLKSKGNCNKCGKYFAKKNLLFKHYVKCEGLFQAPASALDPIKCEGGNSRSVKISDAQSKGPKKKTVANRKMSTIPSIVKTEIHLNDTVDDDNYSNYDEDITYDNFGNDSDSSDAPNGILEPVVELRENSIIKIKQEKFNNSPVIQQNKNSDFAEIARNIKKEKGSTPTVITQQEKNQWKLKIKAEKGSNAKSATQYLNPMAVGMNKSKQIFKLPQQLRMKIKMEKKDAGYGDNMEEERDEADPEDEDLMGDMTETTVVKIKQEKIDPAYGDSRDSTTTKQLINPAAMALMRREKSISNGVPENSPLLVISAVTTITSINPDSLETVTEGTMTRGGDGGHPLETSKTNDDTEEERDTTRAMVQIPSEFVENHKNHSSPQVDDCDESSSQAENISNDKTLSTNATDDLDTLLKKFESQTPVDNSDIFQELLKSD